MRERGECVVDFGAGARGAACTERRASRADVESCAGGGCVRGRCVGSSPGY